MILCQHSHAPKSSQIARTVIRVLGSSRAPAAKSIQTVRPSSCTCGASQAASTDAANAPSGTNAPKIKPQRHACFGCEKPMNKPKTTSSSAVPCTSLALKSNQPTTMPKNTAKR